MPRAPRTKPAQPFSPRTAFVILLSATSLAFAPVLAADFTSWDDYETVARNPALTRPTADGFVALWTRPHMDLYVPVTYTVWRAVAQVARREPSPPSHSPLDPRAFHALNLILHLAGAAVVMAILLELLDNAVRPALLGALLFALHPVQVEPVAWVSGTKDVLCGLLSLVAIWRYLAYARRLTRPDADVPAPQRGSRAYVIATTCFVLAMLAKPTAVVVPGVAALLDWLILRRPPRHILRALWPWALLALPCIAWTKHFQPAARLAADAVAPAWARPFIAGDALAFNLVKLVAPLRLTFDYGRTPQRVMQGGLLYVAWILPAALALTAWWLRRTAPALAAGFAIFVVVLLPVLGFVPFDFQYYSTVADHYLYLAMLGPALAAGFAINRVKPARRRLTMITCGVVLALLGARSFAQALTWRDSQRLFEHALRINPASFASHNSLAAAALERGDVAAAVQHARAAIEDNPRFPSAHVTLGLAAAMAGDADAAIRSYREALRHDPGNVAAMSNLSAALSQRGELDEAEALARRAIELRPASSSAHVNLGMVMVQRQRISEALAAFEAAVLFDPADPAARTNLATVLAATGQTEAAVTHLEQALRIDPSYAPARRALAELRGPRSSIAPR